MPLLDDIRAEIDRTIIHLIEIGLCEAQNFPSVRQLSNNVFEVGLSSGLHTSIPLRGLEYEKVYFSLRDRGSFNMKLLDGAFLILHYRVTSTAIIAHRLAFFPSPVLDDFQGSPEKYREDQLYADIVDKRIVPFPIRFDYLKSIEGNKVEGHPDCHLTLGQYKGCRIPVSTPLSPITFVDFIVQHFYTPVVETLWRCPRAAVSRLDSCISDSELARVHLVIPG